MAAIGRWITRRRLPLLAGLAVLVCAVAALAAWAMAPRQRVSRAIENTAAAMAARPKADLERLGLPLARVGQAATEQTFYLGAPPGPLVPDTGVSAEAGAGLVLRSDPPGGVFSAAASLQAGRVPVYQTTLQGREDLLALRVPSLSMGSYGVNPATLGADWNASALAELSGIALDEGLGFDPAELIRRPLWPESTTRMTAAGQNLLAEMDASRLGREAWEGRGCAVYGFTVGEAAVAAFLREAAAALREAPAANLGRAAALLGEGALPGEAQALLDAAWRAADALESVEAGALEGKIWLRGGRVRRMTLECAVDGDLFAAELILGAGEDPLDGFALLLEVEDTKVELRLTGGAASPEGALDRSFSASWAHGSEKATLEGRLQIDLPPSQGGVRLRSGRLGLEAALEAGSMQASLQMAGSLEADAAVETMAVVLDDCLFSLGESNQPFTAEYSLSPLTAVTLAEWDPVMVLALSEDRLLALAEALELPSF